jgi:putative PIN family toxin of toxin-antitoxin system
VTKRSKQSARRGEDNANRARQQCVGASHHQRHRTRAALYQLIQPPHELILSSAVLDDLGDALRYPRLRARHGLSDAKIDEVVMAIQSRAEFVTLPDSATTPTVSADRDDDFIIATAVLSHADVLCTLDKHLHSREVIDYCRANRISVQTDTALLMLLRAQ